jgi:hypothetical protein
LRGPRDLSIMTVTCDVRRLNFGQGPVVAGLRLSSVDVDSASLARRAFDVVEEIARSATPHNQTGNLAQSAKLYYAAGALIVGESTVPPPST